MRVVVAGATGLVGATCVRELLRHPDVDAVVAIVRRPWPEAPHDPRCITCLADLAAPDVAFAGEAPVDAVVCALGTTMRQAGSREAFGRVDRDYVVALADAARRHDVPHFAMVSALGANASSSVFYNRAKGEAEAAVRALRFPRLTIARPSLLVGPRREVRPVEVLWRVLGVLAPPRWRPVPAERVARALVHELRHPVAGERVLDNTHLRQA